MLIGRHISSNESEWYINWCADHRELVWRKKMFQNCIKTPPKNTKSPLNNKSVGVVIQGYFKHIDKWDNLMYLKGAQSRTFFHICHVWFLNVYDSVVVALYLFYRWWDNLNWKQKQSSWISRERTTSRYICSTLIYSTKGFNLVLQNRKKKR